jgi:hypothetical protein
MIFFGVIEEFVYIWNPYIWRDELTIIMGSHVLDLVSDYRLCWISGRYGGFKTLLAVEIAEHFLKRGYRLITNIKSPWADDWGKINFLENGTLRAVILMDEAGLTLRYTEQLESMCAYSRKMDCIYLFPSFFPPVRYAQVLNLHSVYGFHHLMIPIRVWQCRIKIGGWRDTSTFATSEASRIYGIYSTQSVDLDTEGIIEFMAEKVDRFRELFGGKRIRGLEKDRTSPFSGFADSVGALAEVADDFAAIPTRSRGRK